MLRQHQHPVLARVQAVAPGIIAALATFAPDRAVAIQVQTAGHAGVHFGEVAIGIVQSVAAAGLRLFQIVALEQVGGTPFGVVVEFVEQDQVRAHLLQHCGHLARAFVAVFEPADQAAGLVVVQGDVVTGHAQLRPGRGGRS